MPSGFLLDPKFDYEFKQVFSVPECFKSFFCAMTGVDPATITSIEFIDRDLHAPYKGGKEGAVDVCARFNSKTTSSIDMQILHQEGYLKRAWLYTIALMSMYIAKAGDKPIHFGNTYTLHILDYILFPDIPQCVHKYEMVCRALLDKAQNEVDPAVRKALEEYALRLSDDCQIYFIEIKKESLRK